MKPIYKNILLIIKIFLPAISCFVFLQLFSVMLTDYTHAMLIFFGIIIVFFNFSKVKYNYFISFIISIVLSYITFFLTIAIMFGIQYILMQFMNTDKIGDTTLLGFQVGIIFLIIPVAIISPLLMFYSFQILFKIKKNSWFKIIEWISIVILIIYGLISREYKLDYTIAWQMTMALSLQLILYQDEIKSLFKK